MRIFSRLKYAFSNELFQESGLYLVGLFFFLSGIFAGLTCHLRAGASLGAGAAMGVFSAIVMSVLPFALIIMCAPFLLGAVGLCSVMIWQGLLFGCGPSLPLALLQMLFCLPPLFYMYRRGLSLSLKWCKIRRANAQIRLGEVSALLPAAFICSAIQFISRIPAFLPGG